MNTIVWAPEAAKSKCSLSHQCLSYFFQIQIRNKSVSVEWWRLTWGKRTNFGPVEANFKQQSNSVFVILYFPLLFVPLPLLLLILLHLLIRLLIQSRVPQNHAFWIWNGTGKSRPQRSGCNWTFVSSWWRTDYFFTGRCCPNCIGYVASNVGISLICVWSSGKNVAGCGRRLFKT